MIPIHNTQHFLQWLAENVQTPQTRKQLTSGVSILAGTGVYIHTDGKVYPYTTSNNDKYIGIAENTVNAFSLVTVVTHGFLRIVGSGWVAGTLYYVQSGGSLITTETDRRVAVGVGVDTIFISNISVGGSTPSQEGFSKTLMLMGG